jgi:hypothetical protein
MNQTLTTSPNEPWPLPVDCTQKQALELFGSIILASQPGLDGFWLLDGGVICPQGSVPTPPTPGALLAIFSPHDPAQSLTF